MNELEKSMEGDSETTGLRQQIVELRRQFSIVYVALTVLSLTLAAFIGLQARWAGKDLDTVRLQAKNLVETNAKERPVIENLVAQLLAYGKGHPDYAEKVLAKFKGLDNIQSAAGQKK